jgi:hypothetical protein
MPQLGAANLAAAARGEAIAGPAQAVPIICMKQPIIEGRRLPSATTTGPASRGIMT